MSYPLLSSILLLFSTIKSTLSYCGLRRDASMHSLRRVPVTSWNRANKLLNPRDIDNFQLWGEMTSQNVVNGDFSVDNAINAISMEGENRYKDRANGMPLLSTTNGSDEASHSFSLTIGSSQPQKSLPTKAAVPLPIVLWRFTRPHTIIGSAIAIPSIFLLASPTYAAFFTRRSITALAYATFPALLMNLYITGLNQITDVEIDKINKPELPMANGDLKQSTAIGVILIALVTSLAMSVIHPLYSTSGLQLALWGSFILGTFYSLPPFRMKRHPFLAAFCIVVVRGTIINAGFYSHALSVAFPAASRSVAVKAGVLQCLLHDWKCTFSSLFFGIFGIVIALMKDVPDAQGDRIFNIRSFTVRVGQKRVFAAMTNLLALLFGIAGGALMKWAITAPSMGVAVRRSFVGLGCCVAGWSTKYRASEVDAENSGDAYSYYMHLWKLFYLSYFALPFIK